MSYARLGADGSNVYVFLDAGGYLTCCGCRMSDQSVYLTNTDEMIAHLDRHRTIGHTVPDCTYEQLRADQAENDKWIRTGDDSVFDRTDRSN